MVLDVKCNEGDTTSKIGTIKGLDALDEQMAGQTPIGKREKVNPCWRPGIHGARCVRI
jgi:hypothetical protein